MKPEEYRGIQEEINPDDSGKSIDDLLKTKQIRINHAQGRVRIPIGENLENSIKTVKEALNMTGYDVIGEGYPSEALNMTGYDVIGEGYPSGRDKNYYNIIFVPREDEDEDPSGSFYSDSN